MFDMTKALNIFFDYGAYSALIIMQYGHWSIIKCILPSKF